ncbi:ERF family protein [Candidatus Pacearchaeota archaeon]|nr:ERF family protein [Candidatus Pacearchaeota archaeon]
MKEKNEIAKMNESKEIAAGGMDINKIMELAIEKGDLDKVEKMMELQERYEIREAKKAYVAAMTAFKADPPRIEKDSHVKFKTSKGTTEYKHANLANASDKINRALSVYGLSAAWETNQDERGIAVTCKITHILGHCETTTLKAGGDDSGGKNKIQAIGSTVTYLERYTLLALTGLATHEEDDDGAGSEAIYIDEEQMATINEFIESIGGDCLKNFKKYIEVDDLDKILAKDYKKAITALKNTEKNKKGAK